MLFRSALPQYLGRLSGNESGQSAIFIVLVMFLFGAFGLMVVDAGSWYGDRRDAQGDADFAALAGAQALPRFDDDEAAVLEAEAAAESWAAANGVDPSQLTVEVIDTCFSGSDEVHTGVRVTVERTPSSFFIGLFPAIPDPVVRTTAVACSGSPAEMIGFMPWALEVYGDCFQDDPGNPAERIPIYGERCDIVVGGSGSETGNVGQLGFDPGSSSCADGGGSADEYEANIIYGVQKLCAVGDSVSSNPGVNVGKTRSGLATRLLDDGQCGTNAEGFFSLVQDNTDDFNAHPVITDLANPDFGGIDDFFEIWGPGLGYDLNHPAEHLSPYDCDPSTSDRETSPRNVVTIMINDIGVGDGTGCTGGAVGSHCYEIRGFARMYVEGCSTAAQGFRADCSQGGGGGTFTIHARFVEAVGLSSGNLELSRLGDIQTFLKE